MDRAKHTKRSHGTDPRKKRVHFNAFMLDVHRKIHHWRHNERKSTDEDPISPVAQKISNEVCVTLVDAHLPI